MGNKQNKQIIKIDLNNQNSDINQGNYNSNNQSKQNQFSEVLQREDNSSFRDDKVSNRQLIPIENKRGQFNFNTSDLVYEHHRKASNLNNSSVLNLKANQSYLEGIEPINEGPQYHRHNQRKLSSVKQVYGRMSVNTSNLHSIKSHLKQGDPEMSFINDNFASNDGPQEKTFPNNIAESQLQPQQKFSLIPMIYQEGNEELAKEPAHREVLVKLNIKAKNRNSLQLPKSESLLEEYSKRLKHENGYKELSQLCTDHHLSLIKDPQMEKLDLNDYGKEFFNTIEDKNLNRSNKFFTNVLVYIIETYNKEINEYLREILPSDFDKEELMFFDSNYHIYNDDMLESDNIIDYDFNFIGFSEKKYYIKQQLEIKKKDNVNVNNKNPESNFLNKFNLSSANEQGLVISNQADMRDHEYHRPELLIINTEKKYLEAGFLFALRIFNNGKLYAGCLDSKLNFQGCGVYISKSGNIISGIFEDNEIKYGKCLCFKTSSLYEGFFKNLKKHGTNHTEDSEYYSFQGDFENGKKMKGKYSIKQNYYERLYAEQFNLRSLKSSILVKPYKVRTMEIDRKIYGSRSKITLLTPKEETFSYMGNIVSNSIYDDNGQLIMNLEHGYPKYEGEFLSYNKKQGKGKYSWDEKTALKSFFHHNRPNSKTTSESAKGAIDSFSLENFSRIDELYQNQEIEKSTITHKGKEFDCVFKEGALISFKEVDKKEE